MNSFVSRRCRECGVGKVRLVSKAGRQTRYRTMANVEVPADLELPTCDNCNVEWLDEASASRLDAALEAVYREELGKRVRGALDELINVVPQRELERLIGLSQGYLSKLRSGDRAPSPDLVTLLGLLANDVSRVEEVKAMWGDSQIAAVAAEAHPVDRDVSQFLWSNQVGNVVRIERATTGPTSKRNTTSKAA